jgi:hypothetical protein
MCLAQSSTEFLALHWREQLVAVGHVQFLLPRSYEPQLLHQLVRDPLERGQLGLVELLDSGKDLAVMAERNLKQQLEALSGVSLD